MLQARLRFSDIDWLDLRALVTWAPPTSATHRATRPDHWVTPEVQFLREVDFNTRVLIWHNTADGQKGIRPPKPVPLTVAERRAAKPESEKYDAKPVAEVLDFLGWKRQKTERR